MPVSVITGGAGFIGSHLADKLVELGHTVRVLDDLSSGLESNLDGIANDIEFIEGNLIDEGTARRAVEGADIVFHLGAVGSVPRSIALPMDTHQANATGTLNMLIASRDAGVQRFVYSSSSSVYGDHPALPKSEPNIGLPLSPYAVSKSIGEHYCRLFHELYDFSATSLRFFNVFGPRQRADHVYAAVIPRFIDAALSGRPLQVNGDGTQSRDFTFVADNVAGILSVLEAPDDNVVGQTFNLARGGRLNLLDLISILEQTLDAKLEVEFGEPRAGDIPHSFADVSKLRAATQHAPSHTVEQGVAATVDWFRTLQ